MPSPVQKSSPSAPKSCAELFPNSIPAQVGCEVVHVALLTMSATALKKISQRQVHHLVQRKAPPSLQKIFKQQKALQDIKKALKLLNKTLTPSMPFLVPLPGLPMLLPSLMWQNVGKAAIQGATTAQARPQSLEMLNALPYLAGPGAVMLNQAPTLFGEAPLTEQMVQGLEDLLGL